MIIQLKMIEKLSSNMLKVVANMQNLNNNTVLLVLLFELCVSGFKKKRNSWFLYTVSEVIRYK